MSRRVRILHQGVGHRIILTRAKIVQPSIETRIEEAGVGYMKLGTLADGKAAEVKTALNDLMAKGAQKLVLDLRDNPGGLLDSAVNLGGWLLEPQSLVVQEKYGNGLVEQQRADGNARLSKMPVTVIINGGSASASEILAGALHDIRNVPLVGEKSFGKGSVQQLENFYNGSSLKVTIAKWLTPNGISISDTGIMPTVEVKISPEDLASDKIEIGNPDKDPQLAKAIEVINGLK